MTDGRVVTFYSYKGGVGRSFALSNIAVMLAGWGFRVLCMDWDMDAPGLSSYFAPFAVGTSLKHRTGLLDIIEAWRRDPERKLPWSDHVSEVLVGDTLLSLVTVGEENDDQAARVARLNWKQLYRRGLGSALEEMTDEMRSQFDFVLIDARTGITDFSAILTSQLPDILLLLFTANEQSVQGVRSVAQRSITARNRLPLDKARLLVLPVPSRFEARVEYQVADLWRRRFLAELSEFYRAWLPEDGDPASFLNRITIPYVPFWSFGEHVPALGEDRTDPGNVTHALETIAALLAEGQAGAADVLRDRSALVSRAAQRGDEGTVIPSDFFIIFPPKLSREAKSLGNQLYLARYSSVLLQQDKRREALERGRRAKALIALTSADVGFDSEMEMELRRYVSAAAKADELRPIIPVVIGPDITPVPSNLSHYKAIFVNARDTQFEGAAAEIINSISQVTRSVGSGNRSYPPLTSTLQASGRILRQSSIEDTPVSSFAAGVLDILERTEYQRVVSADLNDPVYRLRYEAYRREEYVPANAEGSIVDHFDDTNNSQMFGMRIDGELVGSIRIHILSSEQRTSPSMSVAADLIDPMLDAGRCLIDPSRMVADYDASLAYPAMPFLLLRLAVMASEHFSADGSLALVREEHSAFYRRVFGAQKVSDVRTFPGLSFPVALFLAPADAANRRGLFRRYPFFRSTESERKALFEHPDLQPVRATASEAMKKAGVWLLGRPEFG